MRGRRIGNSTESQLKSTRLVEARKWTEILYYYVRVLLMSFSQLCLESATFSCWNSFHTKKPQKRAVKFYIKFLHNSNENLGGTADVNYMHHKNNKTRITTTTRITSLIPLCDVNYMHHKTPLYSIDNKPFWCTVHQ